MILISFTLMLGVGGGFASLQAFYLCRRANCEASVPSLTMISIDRFCSVIFPFSRARLTPKSAKIILSIIWSITFILSLVPVLLAGPDSDFYHLSDVCIGLPLITRPAGYTSESS